MPKKKIKKSRGKLHFFYTTRTGFYSLVGVTVILMLATINMYGAANFDNNVLGESTGNGNSAKNEEAKNPEEKRHEIQQRIEANKKEFEEKYNIQLDNIMLEYQSKSDQVKRNVEIKNGERKLEVEVKEKIGDDIEKEFEEINDAVIASGSSDVIISKNNIKARSGFPLRIDAATNQLIIIRPDGTTKVVAVLPDKAVANFIRHKKIDLINFEDTNSTPSADTGETGTPSAQETLKKKLTEIKLIEFKDKVVYEIKGNKKLKFLGLFDVTTPTTGYVSAETGEVVGQEEPLITQFLDILSP